MKDFDAHDYWEHIYHTKQLFETGWYQPIPSTTLGIVKEFNIPLAAKIIDIGGGDSYLVDHLLNLGYTNITVLDISETAIARAKKRLGTDAERVKWIVADISAFHPTGKYDFWHDRAAFHFLTNDTEIDNYIRTAHQGISPNGILVIGTFSEQGPKKCSGLEIRQYSEKSMTERFKIFFSKIKCIPVDHTTPFHTIQNYIFCIFRKLPAG